MVKVWEYINREIKGKDESLSPMLDSLEASFKFLGGNAVSSEDPGYRQMVSRVNQICVRLWKEVFFRYEENKDRHAMTAILHFGVVNETLIDENRREEIDHLSEAWHPRETILDLFYWMRAIYRGKILPSMDENGISFLEHYNSDGKKLKRSEQINRYKVSEPRTFVDYEFGVIASVARKLTFFNRDSYYYFHQHLSEMAMERLYTTPSKILENLEELRNVDFGLFYRSSIRYIGGKAMKVFFEAKPYFILVPICSEKMLFWSANQNNDPSTRGRIFIPIYFKGNDFKREFFLTMGIYRWETQKREAGVYWMDPAEGGLAGKFYDFFENYDRVVTDVETVQEIADRKLKCRKNIALLFSEYYLEWITKEAEGVLILPRELRKMFWLVMPMKRAYRTKLKSNGQHAASIINITNRRKNEYKRVKAIFDSLKGVESEKQRYIEATLYYLSC